MDERKLNQFSIHVKGKVSVETNVELGELKSDYTRFTKSLIKSISEWNTSKIEPVAFHDESRMGKFHSVLELVTELPEGEVSPILGYLLSKMSTNHIQISAWFQGKTEAVHYPVVKTIQTNEIKGFSSYLSLELEIPDHYTDEQIAELSKQAALALDDLNRSEGGNGLKVVDLEVYSIKEEERVES